MICNIKNLEKYLIISFNFHTTIILSKNLFEHNKLGYNFSSWGRGKVWSLRLPVTQEVAGSNPVVPAKGQIAQSVEHLSEKQGVGSSILPLATNL